MLFNIYGNDFSHRLILKKITTREISYETNRTLEIENTYYINVENSVKFNRYFEFLQKSL